MPCDAHLVHVARPERLLPYPEGVPAHVHDYCEAYGVAGAERIVAAMQDLFSPNGLVRCVYDLTTGKAMSERGTWTLWREAGVVQCPLGYGHSYDTRLQLSELYYTGVPPTPSLCTMPPRWS